jgi:hypothetical protein
LATDPGTSGKYALQVLKVGSTASEGLSGSGGLITTALLEFAFVLVVLLFLVVPSQPLTSTIAASSRIIELPRINRFLSSLTRSREQMNLLASQDVDRKHGLDECLAGFFIKRIECYKVRARLINW